MAYLILPHLNMESPFTEMEKTVNGDSILSYRVQKPCTHPWFSNLSENPVNSTIKVYPESQVFSMPPLIPWCKPQSFLVWITTYRPASALAPLPSIPNWSARVNLKYMSHHVIVLFRSLPWLLISHRRAKNPLHNHSGTSKTFTFLPCSLCSDHNCLLTDLPIRQGSASGPLSQSLESSFSTSFPSSFCSNKPSQGGLSLTTVLKFEAPFPQLLQRPIFAYYYHIMYYIIYLVVCLHPYPQYRNSMKGCSFWSPLKLQGLEQSRTHKALNEY